MIEDVNVIDKWIRRRMERSLFLVKLMVVRRKWSSIGLNDWGRGSYGGFGWEWGGTLVFYKEGLI